MEASCAEKKASKQQEEGHEQEQSYHQQHHEQQHSHPLSGSGDNEKRCEKSATPSLAPEPVTTITSYYPGPPSRPQTGQQQLLHLRHQHHLQSQSRSQSLRCRSSHNAPLIQLLPMELQVLICSYLDYGELQTLRRTNQFYRNLINLDFVRICLGSIQTDNELRFVCRTCMRYDRSGRRLVWALTHRAQPPPSDGDSSSDEDDAAQTAPRRSEDPPRNLGYCPDPSVPLAGHCTECAVRLRQLCPGEYVLTLAGERKVRVCRWCGWPCNIDQGKEEYWPHSAWELHPRCAQVYQMVLVGHYILVCIRSGLAFVTYILLWRLFADTSLVVVPSIIAFLLMGIILAIVYFRGREVRSYHVVGSLEFAILCLGIPPLYVMVKRLEKDYHAGLIATEVLLVTHLVVRLINVLGNIVLFLEYDVTKHHAPGIPAVRRLVFNPWIAGLVFWTSPRALENLWIGRGKHPRHKSFRRGISKAWSRAGEAFSGFWTVHSRSATDIEAA